MKVIFAKASVERKPEFRQHTIILQDGENRIVRKIAAGTAARAHIREYSLNYEKLEKGTLPGGNIRAIPCMEEKDGSVQFPYCTEDTLAELLSEKTAEEYIQAVTDFRNALIRTYGTETFAETEQFTGFFDKAEGIPDEQALKITNADLNFDNIFCSESQDHSGKTQEYTMIDYEWILPFPVPVSFLFYRAFLLDGTFHRFPEEEQQKIFNAFGITEALIPVYQGMEAAFLDYISPEEEKLDHYARTETAMTRTQHTLEHLLRMPEENQKLAKDLDRELKTAVELSGALKETQEKYKEAEENYIREQKTAVELSGALKETQEKYKEAEENYIREQKTAVSLSDELGKTQDKVVQLIDDLGKTQEKYNEEQKRTVELSDELGKTQQNVIRLTGELEDTRQKHTEEQKRAVWLSEELGNTQKQYAELIDQYNGYASRLWFRVFRKLGAGKNRILTALKRIPLLRKGGKFFRCLVKEGPKAAVARTESYLKKKQTEQAYIEKASDVSNLDAERATVFPKKVKFSILVPLYNTPRDFLVEMIQSVQEQTYRNWELCLADGSDEANAEVGEICRKMAKEDPRIKYRKLEKNLYISGNTNECIKMSTGDYIALFDHDDLLHPSALYENMKVICEQDADFIYSDEVVFVSPDIHNLIATHFKPDFAPDNLLSNNYICHFSVFKKSLLKKTEGFRDECNGSQDHDIILRLTGVAKKVVHIPKVLYYWRSHPTSVASDISTKTYAIDNGRFAVKDFLGRSKQIQADVVSTDAYPTMYHVKYPLAGNPSVAIIIDLSDEENPEKKSTEIIPELSGRTDYPNVQIVFFSAKERKDTATSKIPVIWIAADGQDRPVRLNQSARAVNADYLVFMDKDLVPQNKNWLEEMLILAQQDHAGAVGAKIEFTDGSLRHGGLILQLGKNRMIGRSHFRVGHENSGYFGQLAIVEDVSAVSAECMMIRKNVFEKAGGFAETYKDSLYDADLCLKLRKKGLYNIYTPFALLQGGDSQGYSIDFGMEFSSYASDAQEFRKRWEDEIRKPDPFYNPNLTLDYSDYRIREDL